MESGDPHLRGRQVPEEEYQSVRQTIILLSNSHPETRPIHQFPYSIAAALTPGRAPG